MHAGAPCQYMKRYLRLLLEIETEMGNDLELTHWSYVFNPMARSSSQPQTQVWSVL